MNISLIIKQKREDMGLTQAGLAEKLGVTKHTIHCYEVGARYPTDKIADLLGIPRKSESDARLRGIYVGAHGKVRAECIGMINGKKHSYPCVCIDINPQGVVCLEFTVRGGKVRECFPLSDPALAVEWR